MPVYRNRTVLEIARVLKAFLNLDVGLARGAVPDPGQKLEQLEQARSRVERLRKQLSKKDRQLEQLRGRLSERDRLVAALRADLDASSAGDQGYPAEDRFGSLIEDKNA